VISDRGQPWTITPKVFYFRSDAKNVRVLQVAQIDSLSIANNHALDYEFEAMFDMRDLVAAGGVSAAGAGGNLEEAARPAISSVVGQRVGMIAFTDNEPWWEATAQRAGGSTYRSTRKTHEADVYFGPFMRRRP
jgi:poly-gamma-glutamate synthesis protein (capsule biosynthesis protein)